MGRQHRFSLTASLFIIFLVLGCMKRDRNTDEAIAFTPANNDFQSQSLDFDSQDSEPIEQEVPVNETADDDAMDRTFSLAQPNDDGEMNTQWRAHLIPKATTLFPMSSFFPAVFKRVQRRVDPSVSIPLGPFLPGHFIIAIAPSPSHCTDVGLKFSIRISNPYAPGVPMEYPLPCPAGGSCRGALVHAPRENSVIVLYRYPQDLSHIPFNLTRIPYSTQLVAVAAKNTGTKPSDTCTGTHIESAFFQIYFGPASPSLQGFF